MCSAYGTALSSRVSVCPFRDSSMDPHQPSWPEAPMMNSAPWRSTQQGIFPSGYGFRSEADRAVVGVQRYGFDSAPLPCGSSVMTTLWLRMAITSAVAALRLSPARLTMTVRRFIAQPNQEPKSHEWLRAAAAGIAGQCHQRNGRAASWAGLNAKYTRSAWPLATRACRGTQRRLRWQSS